ncbi:MAG: glycosyltransferase family 1 protein [Acidobacteriota bacterium]|nr:glycosyltransferase family 1 protein [Acidobacteriota bacterium]
MNSFTESAIKSVNTFDATVPDLICVSHLRWDFVYQRPQHLLSRFATQGRVFFVEEPVFGDYPSPQLDVSQRENNLCVAVPQLPHGMSTEEIEAAQKKLLDQLIIERCINHYVLWYYTPMALGWTSHLRPLAVVYDCMDELSEFKNAPPNLRARETELFSRADLVFTGGQSLYEAKREQHPQIFCFPSSIDAPHFAQARSMTNEPADQASIPRPHLGYFGVIDERMDAGLLDAVAAARSDWQLIMIGPVVKIDPAELPRRPNIHYLGGKSYQELPAYLAGWDVALLPFACNESTRFISPTKTPEYLAAGRPVVSTSIRDVVRPYGEMALVHIADTPAEFIAAIERALQEDVAQRLREVDRFLAQTSWDRTWGRMKELLEDVIKARRAPATTARSAAAATNRGAPPSAI